MPPAPPLTFTWEVLRLGLSGGGQIGNSCGKRHLHIYHTHVKGESKEGAGKGGKIKGFDGLEHAEVNP